MDVKVTRREDGNLKTELYVKPIDRTRYLHKDSDHPRHVKEGIAKGQSRRRLKMEVEDGGKSGPCGKARKLCMVMRETSKGKAKDGCCCVGGNWER